MYGVRSPTEPGTPSRCRRDGPPRPTRSPPSRTRTARSSYARANSSGAARRNSPGGAAATSSARSKEARARSASVSCIHPRRTSTTSPANDTHRRVRAAPAAPLMRSARGGSTEGGHALRRAHLRVALEEWCYSVAPWSWSWWWPLPPPPDGWPAPAGALADAPDTGLGGPGTFLPGTPLTVPVL